MSLPLSRRRFLSGVGTVGSAGFAGCISASNPSRTRIGEIVFVNLDETPHRVRLRIETNGKTVFRTVQEVPRNDTAQPVVTRADGLPTKPSRYTIVARLDDGADSIQRTVPEGGDGDCHSVTVRIDSDGTFRDMPTDGSWDGCTQ